MSVESVSRDDDNIFFQKYMSDLIDFKNARSKLVSELFCSDILFIVSSYLKDAILYHPFSYSVVIYDERSEIYHRLILRNDKNKMIKIGALQDKKLIFGVCDINTVPDIVFESGLESGFVYFDERACEFMKYKDFQKYFNYFVNLLVYKLNVVNPNNGDGINLRGITVPLREWVNESLGIVILDLMYSNNKSRNKILEMRCIYCGNLIRNLKYAPVENFHSFAVDASPLNKNTNYYTLHQIENKTYLEIRDLFTDELKFKFVSILGEKLSYSYLNVYGDQLYMAGDKIGYKLLLNYEYMSFEFEYDRKFANGGGAIVCYL